MFAIDFSQTSQPHLDHNCHIRQYMSSRVNSSPLQMRNEPRSGGLEPTKGKRGEKKSVRNAGERMEAQKKADAKYFSAYVTSPLVLLLLLILFVPCSN